MQRFVKTRTTDVISLLGDMRSEPLGKLFTQGQFVTSRRRIEAPRRERSVYFLSSGFALITHLAERDSA